MCEGLPVDILALDFVGLFPEFSCAFRRSHCSLGCVRLEACSDNAVSLAAGGNPSNFPHSHLEQFSRFCRNCNLSIAIILVSRTMWAKLRRSSQFYIFNCYRMSSTQSCGLFVLSCPGSVDGGGGVSLLQNELHSYFLYSYRLCTAIRWSEFNFVLLPSQWIRYSDEVT